MARKVDMSNPKAWDEDDVRYLKDRGRLPEDFTGEVPDDSGAEGEEVEVYEDYDDGWTNDERREELAKRGLSTEGKKDELIARLLEDDESKA